MRNLGRNGWAIPISRGCRVGGSDASRRVAKISSTLRTSRTSDAAKLTQEWQVAEHSRGINTDTLRYACFCAVVALIKRCPSDPRATSPTGISPTGPCWRRFLQMCLTVGTIMTAWCKEISICWWSAWLILHYLATLRKTLSEVVTGDYWRWHPSPFHTISDEFCLLSISQRPVFFYCSALPANYVTVVLLLSTIENLQTLSVNDAPCCGKGIKTSYRSMWALFGARAFGLERMIWLFKEEYLVVQRF